jgi:hypothetical protein
MIITDRHIDQSYSDLKSKYGGVREDYFAFLYLIQEFNISKEDAANQIAFGGNDYGVDAFHIDTNRRNLYLFQFKWSSSHTLFKQSLVRLIDAGMERIFGDVGQDQKQNQLLLQLKGRLLEDQALVDRVIIHFVFTGKPEEAERSQALDKLREDLEDKKYLLDKYFGRPIDMAIQYRSATKRVGTTIRPRVTHKYPVKIVETILRRGPNGENMQIGFIPLMDLNAMYIDMAQHFFERNIRASLSEDEAPNRAITRALRDIILEEKESPLVFAFNHNGVTIYAEHIEKKDGIYEITEPRLLNGAQTVTTFSRFLKKNEGNPRIRERDAALKELYVLCKIITDAKPEFVVNVTINNNRQNPVMPWNLHANDMIQLELQDKFREELNIYYERQENAFASLSQQDLDEMDITEYKAVELVRLAQTILATEGEIDKVSRMRDVFENEKTYVQVFNPSCLQADGRKVILCYKVQFRLRRMIREIIEKGVNKYAYLSRARNLLWALLCQGMLNDERVEDFSERFGHSLVMEADFTEWLGRISSTRARFLISQVVSENPYAAMMADSRYDFLRTKAIFDRCMEIAYKKWKWTQKRLK